MASGLVIGVADAYQELPDLPEDPEMRDVAWRLLMTAASFGIPRVRERRGLDPVWSVAFDVLMSWGMFSECNEEPSSGPVRYKANELGLRYTELLETDRVLQGVLVKCQTL